MRKNKIFKQSALLLCVFVCLTACSKSDEEKIIGKWQCTHNNLGVTTVSTELFKEDGTYESEAVMSNNRAKDEIYVSIRKTMNWSIKDGNIITSNYNWNVLSAKPAKLGKRTQKIFDRLKNKTDEYDLKIDEDTMSYLESEVETTCSRL